MKTVAIIAHDGKKAEMVAFLMEYRKILKDEKIKLIATGTTGSHAENAGLEVKRYQSGPLGGDAQIAAEVVNGNVDMVFFFRDPLGKHPHEPDIQMLMRLCDHHEIPLATNKATAKFLIESIK